MDESRPLGTILLMTDARRRADRSFWVSLISDEDLFIATLEYASRNGLGYLFLESMNSSGITLSPECERELQREKERMSDIRRTILLLNEASEALGIQYAVIKIPCKVPHVPRDIDIYVPSRRRREMMKALRTYGMRSEHSSNVETTMRGEGFAKVDVYSRICYFDYDFLDDDFFSESRTSGRLFDVGCPVLADYASFTMELVHGLFGHRSISLLDFLNLKLLIEGMGGVERSRSIAQRYGWVQAFDLALERFRIIEEEIYNDGEEITFPYLFDQEFVFKCLSSVDGLVLNRGQKALVRISLFIDKLVLQSKDSGLDQCLRANNSVRRLVNSMAHSIRNIRGDRKTTRRE